MLLRCKNWLPLLLLLAGGCSVLEETWLSNAPLPGHSAREVQATFAGNEHASGRTLREHVRPDLLGLSQGLDADAAAFDAADAIAEYYRSEGYPDATASYRVDGPTSRQGEPDLVVVHFDIDEGPRVTISKLELVGNDKARRSQLLPLWSRRNSGALGLGDPLYVLAELRSFAIDIRAWYWRHGYMQATVDGPDVDRVPGADTAAVTLRIAEGRQFHFGTITIGSDITTALGEAMPQSPAGEVFSAQRTQELLLSLRSALLQHGYPDPKIGMAPLPDVQQLVAPHIDVEVRGQPGPKAHYGDIEITGNERTNTGFIRDRLRFHSGDAFDGLAQDQAVERLYRTGLFQRVTLEPGDIEDGKLPLRVRVEELESRSIELLGGYGSYELLRGGARYEDRNLFGSGRELALEGRVSQRGYRLSSTLTDRYLFSTDTTGSLGFERFEREQPSFVDRAFGATATLRRNLGWHVVGRVGYSFLEHTGTDTVPDPSRLESYTQGTVFAELRRDDRNSLVLPTSGTTQFVRADFTDPTFGADVDFDRVRAGASWMAELSDRTVLALNAEAGWLWPNEGSVRVPLPERFFNGGHDSVRSFREDHLGPRDAQGNPLGGEYRNIANLELRQRLYGPLEVTAFADAGNVGASVADYGVRDMRYALGLGLRLQLPIGPVRLDAGWNPDRREGDDAWVLHFAVGYPF